MSSSNKYGTYGKIDELGRKASTNTAKGHSAQVELTHFHEAAKNKDEWDCEQCNMGALPARRWAEFMMHVKYNAVRSWTVAHRFSDFTDLHWSLSVDLGDEVELPELPPKKAPKKLTREFLEERMVQLNVYLKELMKINGIMENDAWLDFIDEPDECWAAVLVQSIFRGMQHRKRVKQKNELKAKLFDAHSAGAAAADLEAEEADPDANRELIPGELSVLAIGAKGLSAIGKTLCSSYVNIRVGKQLQFSNARMKTNEPEWNKRFVFKKIFNPLLNIQIAVQDEEEPSQPDLTDELGDLEIRLQDLPLGQEVTDSYELTDEDGNRRGDIELKVAPPSLLLLSSFSFSFSL
jgi:hypothetical protein